VENLPQSIVNPKNLVHLDLRANRFTRLPDGIAHLAKLRNSIWAGRGSGEAGPVRRFETRGCAIDHWSLVEEGGLERI
jgi:hypothetical protein